MTHLPEVRLALILLRALDDVKNNPEKLRTAIYSLARLKVDQEMRDRDPSEAARALEALEVAIGEVEQFSTDEPLLLASLGKGPALPPSPSVSPSSPLSPPPPPAPSASRMTPPAASPAPPPVPEAREDVSPPEDPVAPVTAEPAEAEAPARPAPDLPDPPVEPVCEASPAAIVLPSEEVVRSLEVVEAAEVVDAVHAVEVAVPVETLRARVPRTPTMIIRPTPLEPIAPSFNEPYYSGYVARGDRRREILRPILPVITVFCVGVIFSAALIWQTRELTQATLSGGRGPGKPELATGAAVSAPIIVAPPAPPPQPPPAPTYPFPLPKAYGVFAIADDKLVQLAALPGRAADPRIAISAEITRPVAVTLSTGNVSFIVYRRDAAMAATDYVDVRAIANIRDHITFEGGKASVAPAGDVWAMRNVAYRLSISPVEGQPDMFILRPQEEGYGFSPGRYGLVLNHQAYDFQVAGTIVDPVHCLEKIAAVNGSFYSPCRNPAGDTAEKPPAPAPAPAALRKGEAPAAKKPAQPR